MSVPRTSILTATRNRPGYLAEAIASVEAQTDPDWEHLIWDDASTDPEVRRVLFEAHRRRPDQIQFIIGEKRVKRGVASIWNAIIRHRVRGRYVTILDDDNRKHPRFLEEMTAPMEADEDVSAVTCGWVYVGEDGRPIPGREPCHWNQATSEVNLWRSNTVDSNAVVFRREVFDRVGPFPDHIPCCEDWHFVIRLMRACRVVHLPDALLDYREHAGAASRRGDDEEMLRARRIVRTELFPGGPPAGAMAGAIPL